MGDEWNSYRGLLDWRANPREFEVFKMIAEGYGSRQIADELKMSIKTVETHRGHIRKKLQLGSTFELVRYARDWVATEK